MQIDKIYTATNIQSAIIAGYLASDQSDYIGQVTIPISEINLDSLNRSVQMMYERHEALRTAFDWQNHKGITAVVADKLPTADYINQYSVKDINSIKDIKTFEANLINLNKPPLMRIALVECYEKSYLLWSRHHAITDQESIKIFWDELWHFYNKPGVSLPNTQAFSDFALLKASQQLDAPTYHDYLYLQGGQRTEHSYTLQSNELQQVLNLQKASNVTLASFALSAFCIALAEKLSSDCFTVGYVETDRPVSFKNCIGPFIKESLIRQDQNQFVTIGDHRDFVFKSVLRQRNSNLRVKHGSQTQYGFLFEDDPDTQSLSTVENDAGISVRLKVFCRVSLFDSKLSIHLVSQASSFLSEELVSLNTSILRLLLSDDTEYINRYQQSSRQYLIDLMWRSWRQNQTPVLADSNTQLSGLDLYNQVIAKSCFLQSSIQLTTNLVLQIKPSRSVDCVVNILSAINVGLPFLLIDANEIGSDVKQLADDLSVAKLETNLPLNTAYLIRSSGSTGNPKTILIHVNNLINHLEYRVSENTYNSRVAHTSSWSFDASLTVLFSTMVNNGFLFISPLITHYTSVNAFLDFIKHHSIYEVNMVPSLLHLLADGGLSNTPIRRITSAGEELTADLVNMILNDDSIQLLNEYGPSECTILTTRLQVLKPVLDNPTIGSPIPGCIIKLFNFNDSMDEICISGNYVGLGYLSEQIKNQSCFFYDQGHLWYRTGDVGRYDNHGNLQWLGRIDNQFKANGKIFSTESIDNEIQRLGVNECKSIWSDSVIYIFFTCNDKTLINNVSLKEAIKVKFGLVCDCIYLEDMPKTDSGKVDLQKLRRTIPHLSFADPGHSEKSNDHSFLESVAGRTLQLNSKPSLDVDSLTAIRLISSVNSKYSCNLSVVSLLSSSTWSDFLDHLPSLSTVQNNQSTSTKIRQKKREFQ